MQYQIKDAEGAFRYVTDIMPIEDKRVAEDYVRATTELYSQLFPNWFPLQLVEIA